MKPEDVAEIVAAHLFEKQVARRLLRTDLPEMKAQIIEHREKYLAMLRAKAEAEKEKALAAAR